MADKNRVFRKALEGVGLYGCVGSASINNLETAFIEMKAALDSKADRNELQAAIERAINEASALKPHPELTADGRGEVLALLRSAFDGKPHERNPKVGAVECNFLSRVRLEGLRLFQTSS